MAEKVVIQVVFITAVHMAVLVEMAVLEAVAGVAHLDG